MIEFPNLKLLLVRPGPAEMLSLAGESDTGLVLTYSVPNMMREFPPGLVQQIRVSNQHEPGEWEELDKIKDADKEVSQPTILNQ